MKFIFLEIFLFLIYVSFYHVTGLNISLGPSKQGDCESYYKFFHGININSIFTTAEDCCKREEIECDNEEYIITLELNGFETIDYTQFPNFSRLEELRIENHPLKEIPNAIFELKSLKRLTFQDDNIEIIPPAIQNLSELESLTLRNGTVKSLPNEISELSKLKSLVLESNQIDSIPSSIKDLSNLKELILNKNTVKNLPSELFKLSKLEKIYIGDNQIDSIPSSIGNLSNLRKLGLERNNIKDIPEELFKLSKLEVLNLSGNKIETIPSTIGDSTALKELILYNNELKELPKELYKLEKLEKFNINFNRKLTTKIIRFGNSTVEDCYFDNVNILCYQPYACKNIHINDETVTDIESEKVFNICTQEEIDEILNQKGKTNYKSLGKIIGIVAAVIVVIFIINLIRKKNSKKV